jgi:hypothetical protein
MEHSIDRTNVIKALECCIIDPKGLEDCQYNGCPYVKEAEETEENESLYCQTCLFADALALLKEQEEREKRICKKICDSIRGTCSTDTDADKDFVCYEIQKRFTEERE